MEKNITFPTHKKRKALEGGTPNPETPKEGQTAQIIAGTAQRESRKKKNPEEQEAPEEQPDPIQTAQAAPADADELEVDEALEVPKEAPEGSRLTRVEKGKWKLDEEPEDRYAEDEEPENQGTDFVGKEEEAP